MSLLALSSSAMGEAEAGAGKGDEGDGEEAQPGSTSAAAAKLLLRGEVNNNIDQEATDETRGEGTTLNTVF